MSNRPTVLIVDDDPDIRLGAALRLRAAGFATLDAVDGIQGVKQAVQHRPDAIVLDVRMPNQDGLSTLAELQDRDDTRNIPVIMLSASIVDQDVALDNGARFFLKKPYQGRKLMAAVQAALESTTASARRPRDIDSNSTDSYKPTPKTIYTDRTTFGTAWKPGSAN